VGGRIQRLPITQAEALRDFGITLAHIWGWQFPGLTGNLPVASVVNDLVGAANLTLTNNPATFVPAPFAGHGAVRMTDGVNAVWADGAANLNVGLADSIVIPAIVRWGTPIAARDWVAKRSTIAPNPSYAGRFNANGTVSMVTRDDLNAIRTATLLVDHSEQYGYAIPFVSRAGAVIGIRTHQGEATLNAAGMTALSDGTGNHQWGRSAATFDAPMDFIWSGGALIDLTEAQRAALGYNLWRGWRGIVEL
jgi:hypothetical protein